MRPVRTALALGSLVALSGCCFELGGGSCVAESWGVERCEPFVGELVCWTDDAQPPPREGRAACWGTYHGDTDCPDLGFTQRCRAGFWVRPGVGC